MLPGRGFRVGRVLWSNPAHSHLSSQGSPPACTPLSGFLPASAGTQAASGELQLRSASDAGVLVQPPLCTQQQLDSVSPCVPWGGTRPPPMTIVPRKRSSSSFYKADSIAQGRHSVKVLFLTLFFFFFSHSLFYCPEICSLNLVLGFRGALEVRSGSPRARGQMSFRLEPCLTALFLSLLTLCG